MPVEDSSVTADMTLSDAQWNNVLGFWTKHIEGDLANIGHEVLIRLFLQSKAAQNLFEKFKHLSSEAEMRGCADLQKHGNTVFTALGKTLKLKGHHDAELRPMAESHSKKHKIPVENFTLICNVIDKYFHEKYPDYAGELRESFKQATLGVAHTLEKLYKEV